MTARRPLLRVLEAGELVIELAPITEPGTDALHMRCRCGGEWIAAWLVDGDGDRIYAAAAGAMLHTVPTCKPFDDLPWYDFHRWAISGVMPARKPLVAGGDDAPPTARPAKPHHR